MDLETKKKALKSVKWSVILSLFSALVLPLYSVYLAVALSPLDFAYIGVLTLLNSFSMLLGNFGIAEAIIKKKEVTSPEISSNLFFIGCLSLGFTVILIAISNSLQCLYDLENLSILIYIFSINILLNGISNIFRVLLQKQLLFKEFSIIQIIRNSLNIICGIGFILAGYGVKGYVLAIVISTGVYLILMFGAVLCKTEYKIQLHFDKAEVKEFLSFGVIVSFKQIFTLITEKLDEIIIGIYLTPEVYGIYFFAKDLIQKPQALVTQTFARVSFSLFSRLQGNIEQLKTTYIGFTRYIGVTAFALFGFVAVTSDDFVPLLFGTEWMDSIFFIKIFCVVGICHVLTANFATSLLYTVNKHKLVLQIDLVANFTYIAILAVLANYGVVFIAYTFAAFVIIKNNYLQYSVGNNIKHSLGAYYGNLKYFFLATIMIVLVNYSYRFAFTGITSIMSIIIVLITSAMVYLGIIYMFERSIINGLLRYVLKKGNKI